MRQRIVLREWLPIGDQRGRHCGVLTTFFGGTTAPTDTFGLTPLSMSLDGSDNIYLIVYLGQETTLSASFTGTGSAAAPPSHFTVAATPPAASLIAGENFPLQFWLLDVNRP